MTEEQRSHRAIIGETLRAEAFLTRDFVARRVASRPMKDMAAPPLATGKKFFQQQFENFNITIMKKRSKKPPSIEVEIPPYGQMLIIGEEADGALAFFKRNWPQLWPKLSHELKRMYKRCELGVISRSRRWLADGSRMPPNVFMSDKSDWFLRLDLDPLDEVESGLPVFDFFIRETRIVHCQPVF